MSSEKSIVIVSGVTKTPHTGPDVGDFVQNTIRTKADLQGVSLSTLELTEFSGAVINELPSPNRILQAEKNGKENSRWVEKVSRYHGYILIASEQHCEAPDSVNKAFNLLYNACKGKPIGIVSFGIDNCKATSAQLANSLTKMGLQVAISRPLLSSQGAGSSTDDASGMTADSSYKNSTDEWDRVAKDVVRVYEEVRTAVLKPSPSYKYK